MSPHKKLAIKSNHVGTAPQPSYINSSLQYQKYAGDATRSVAHYYTSDGPVHVFKPSGKKCNALPLT